MVRKVLSPHAVLLLLSCLLPPGCAEPENPTGGVVDRHDGGPPAPYCGNQLVEEGEVCDDGVLNGKYGQCRRDCQGLGDRCGDELIQLGVELCDEGEANGTPFHCNATCDGPTPTCGDGFLHPATEACDDGDRNGRYGSCRTDCRGLGPRCGDGALQGDEGELCDDGPDNGQYDHCATDCLGPGPHCGDGLVTPGRETCDDGPQNGLPDHCAVNCGGGAPYCGDGVTQPELDEECDDGELNGSYGRCLPDCTRPPFPPPGYPADVVDPSWLEDPPPCREDDWLAKYLEYRRRFRGEGSARYPGFISLGLEAGQSIPATERDKSVNCANDWFVQDSGCTGLEDDPDAQGKYAWGDATIWLGIYLGVLASEHKAFGLLGLDQSQTEQDLFYALSAFDRLDRAAEAHFGVAPALNGFFQRDDVVQGFQLNPDGSYRFPRDEPGIAGYECVTSTADCGELTTAGGSFESQDQVIGLLEGLGLIHSLVPDGVVVEGMDLRQHAREIVHRLVGRLKDHEWRVVDPTGTSPPDKWGGNAIGFSSKLARAANRICGDDFGVADYEDELSQVGEGIFALLEAGWEQTFSYNRNMALRLQAITGDWDAEKYTRFAVGDSKELFAFHHALNQGVPVGAELSLWRMESILGSAPCGGPCREVAGCVEVNGWLGEHRFYDNRDRIGGKYRPGAEYNGLDYMALHNLYLIYRHGRYDFASVIPDPPPECRGYHGLQARIDGTPAPDDRYDPAHPCSAADLDRRFCGRSWAAWLDAAYRGEATIHTTGGIWRCEAGRPCTLVPEPLRGTAGIDLILGTPGDDDLRGLEGDDCLYGFGGNDRIEGGIGRDEIHGGDGDDELYGESENPPLTGHADLIYGDAGNDRLEGNLGRDELYGGLGNDRLLGGTDDDFLDGEEGDDTLDGDSGEDKLRGGVGDDTLRGGSGDDTLWGEEGRDRLAGGPGSDGLNGGPGDDLLLGEGGDDSLVNGNDGGGLDVLCGGTGDDVLWGDWIADLCRGGDELLGRDHDEVNGCMDDSIGEQGCSDEAFDDWL
ncbi:MAG: calcium-binding protein [Myxococcota bacterium]|jgi:hypothetical protein|nr:calcium-binding protein [Myxococcota bacterium]